MTESPSSPPSEEGFTAAAPPNGRRRSAAVAIGGVAVLAAFAAGAVIDRVTAPKTNATSASSVAAIPGTTAFASAPAADAAVVRGKLVSTLIPLPAGGTARTVKGANADGSLSLDQFLQLLYPSSTTERAALQARGFEAAATKWFYDASGQEISIYLIGFSSHTGARSYALALEKAHEANHAADTQFPVPILTDGVGFENAALDSYGNTDSNVYGLSGTVTIIVHCYTPAKLDRDDLLTLVDEQAAMMSRYGVAD